MEERFPLWGGPLRQRFCRSSGYYKERAARSSHNPRAEWFGRGQTISWPYRAGWHCGGGTRSRDQLPLEECYPQGQSIAAFSIERAIFAKQPAGGTLWLEGGGSLVVRAYRRNPSVRTHRGARQLANRLPS